MSDDVASTDTSTDKRDRNGVAASQGYELRYFARKHGLTTAQAMDLIRRIGNDRPRLNEAAVKLRRSLAAGHAKRQAD